MIGPVIAGGKLLVKFLFGSWIRATLTASAATAAYGVYRMREESRALGDPPAHFPRELNLPAMTIADRANWKYGHPSSVFGEQVKPPFLQRFYQHEFTGDRVMFVREDSEASDVWGIFPYADRVYLLIRYEGESGEAKERLWRALSDFPPGVPKWARDAVGARVGPAGLIDGLFGWAESTFDKALLVLTLVYLLGKTRRVAPAVAGTIGVGLLLKGRR